MAAVTTDAVRLKNDLGGKWNAKLVQQQASERKLQTRDNHEKRKE